MANRFDLNHLVVFSKIAETGSLTKAAQALGQPKSRVSRILAGLERDLEVELIHRTTRNLQLTDIGRRFYESCRSPLAGIEEAARDLHDRNEAMQGRIRLTAPQDFGSALLPPLLDEFARAYPKIRFDVILSQESLNLVHDAIDVAIRIGALKDSGLKAHKVAALRAGLAAAPGFLEARAPIHDIKDLTDLPLIGFGSPRAWTFINGKDRETLKADLALSSNNPEFILRMALRGRAVAILPDFLCREPFQDGRLIPICRGWKTSEIPIHLVFPYQKQLPSHVRRFTDFLLPRLKSILGGS